MRPQSGIGRSLPVALALACAVAALVAVAGCARQPLIAEDPLDASPAAEAVLRALHRAGVTDAVVGLDRGVARAYVRLPAADSAADVRAGWATALAALTESYPRASGYVVTLAGPAGEPLVEMSWGERPAPDTTAAELVAAAAVTYPSTSDRPAGEGLLDSADVVVGYLADKNAAAGITREAAGEAFSAVAAQQPGRPAPGPGEDAAVVTAQRIATLLAGATEPSAVALRDSASRIQVGQADSAAVLALRRRLSAVEAMSETVPGEEELHEAADALARSVVQRQVAQSGPKADALLATAASDRAPSSALVVPSFVREPSEDTSASGVGSSVPDRVIAALAAQAGGEPAVTWSGGSVRPEKWLAYRRADGRLFWLAGEQGPVALTDRTVDGFAWQSPVAALVPAENAGEVLTLLALP